MDTRIQYQCTQCGAVGHSIRCRVCGGDADPIDETAIAAAQWEAEQNKLQDRDDARALNNRRPYSIFSHAQLGHTDNLNLVRRRHGIQKSRRFTGESITDFGGL